VAHVPRNRNQRARPSGRAFFMLSALLPKIHQMLRFLCRSRLAREPVDAEHRVRGRARSCPIDSDWNGSDLTNIVLIVREPMATEAHGKHGIFTDNFFVFRGYLSRFRLNRLRLINKVSAPDSRGTVLLRWLAAPARAVRLADRRQRAFCLHGRLPDSWTGDRPHLASSTWQG